MSRRKSMERPTRYYPQRAKHAINDHFHSYAVAKPLTDMACHSSQRKHWRSLTANWRTLTWKTTRSANIHVQSPQNLQKCASYFFIVTMSDILPSETISARIVKQKWFEKISSPHIIRICLGVLRTLGFYINFRQSAINGHQCCVLAHARGNGR